MKFLNDAVQKIASNWVAIVCVWVVVASGTYAFSIHSVAGNFFLGNLDSGLAALLGALIGSGTTIIFGIWQSNAQALQTRANTLFDAKRRCYAEVLAHFTVAGLELGHGKPFPIKNEDVAKHHRVMAELALVCNSEIEEHRLLFIDKIREVMDILKIGKNAKREIDELKQIQAQIRAAMRSELNVQ